MQYAYENHLRGGLSGAIEYIAWHVLKVKNTQIRGQMNIIDPFYSEKNIVRLKKSIAQMEKSDGTTSEK